MQRKSERGDTAPALLGAYQHVQCYCCFVYPALLVLNLFHLAADINAPQLYRNAFVRGSQAVTLTLACVPRFVLCSLLSF